MKCTKMTILVGLLFSIRPVMAEQTAQDAKSEAIQRVFAAIGCAAASVFLATSPHCKNKFGLNIGLSAACMGTAISFLDSANKKMWRQMALGMIPLAGMSAIVSSPAIVGNDGIFARSGIFSHFADTGNDKYGAAAVKGLLTVGGYLALRPKIEQFESWATENFGI